MIAWAAAVVVAGVVAGVWWWRVRWVAGQPEHEAWIRGILGSDREVAELAEVLRRAAREHEGRP